MDAETPSPEPEVPRETPERVPKELRVPRAKFTQGTIVKGPRVVEQHCVDVSKRVAYERYPRLVKIQSITPFLPSHDFQRDMKYLELSRTLNFFDIEVAKGLALGDSASMIFKALFPGGSTKKVGKSDRAAWHIQRIRRRAVIVKPLTEYFRELLGVTKDPNSFSVEEAFRSLVLDVRGGKPGKERFDMTLKLVDLLGMEKTLRTFGQGLMAGGGAPDVNRVLAVVGMTPDGAYIHKNVSNGSPQAE